MTVWQTAELFLFKLTDRRFEKRRNYITDIFGKTAEYFGSKNYPLYGMWFFFIKYYIQYNNFAFLNVLCVVIYI